MDCVDPTAGTSRKRPRAKKPFRGRPKKASFHTPYYDALAKEYEEIEKHALTFEPFEYKTRDSSVSPKTPPPRELDEDKDSGLQMPFLSFGDLTSVSGVSSVDLPRSRVTFLLEDRVTVSRSDDDETFKGEHRGDDDKRLPGASGEKDVAGKFPTITELDSGDHELTVSLKSQGTLTKADVIAKRKERIRKSLSVSKEFGDELEELCSSSISLKRRHGPSRQVTVGEKLPSFEPGGSAKGEDSRSSIFLRRDFDLATVSSRSLARNADAPPGDIVGECRERLLISRFEDVIFCA